MKSKSLAQGSIYEVNFGYNAKMEGYTNLSLYIPELYAMPLLKASLPLLYKNILNWRFINVTNKFNY